jgi:hypothetical protein
MLLVVAACLVRFFYSEKVIASNKGTISRIRKPIRRKVSPVPISNIVFVVANRFVPDLAANLRSAQYRKNIVLRVGLF